jgi:hypothetical protein
VKAAGPAQVRIGVNDGIEVAVRAGRVTIEGEQDKATLAAGDYLSLRDASTPYALRRLPAADSWELWNDERDRLLEGATESRRYLPANIRSGRQRTGITTGLGGRMIVMARSGARAASGRDGGLITMAAGPG